MPYTFFYAMTRPKAVVFLVWLNQIGEAISGVHESSFRKIELVPLIY